MKLKTLPLHINALINTVKQTPAAANTHKYASIHINRLHYPLGIHMLTPTTVPRILGSLNQSKTKTL